MGEDGNNIHLTTPLLSLKAGFTSWDSRVVLCRCCRAGAEHRDRQQILEYAPSMQMGCWSTHLACGDLSFRLFPADTHFICLWYFLVSPGGGSAYLLPGCSSRPPSTACEQGLGRLSPREAVCVDFVRAGDLLVRPQLLLTWCRQRVGRAGRQTCLRPVTALELAPYN